MASAESGQNNEKKTDSEAPLRSMSIARFIPRFTKPRLLTSNIPTYRHSFSLPAQAANVELGESSKAESSNTEPPSKVESPEEPEIPSNASYIEWNKLLPVPSNLLDSFEALWVSKRNLQRASTGGSDYLQARSPATGTSSIVSATPPPRLVFFGEQHHQPEVMRAQLQTLHALHQQCQFSSSPRITTDGNSASEQAETTCAQKPASARTPVYRLHLVLEHFSVLDQDMLNSFSQGKLGPDELAETYQAQSEESFHIGQYMPLLMLAKELNVPIWGGFPPRQWARQVFRDGVDDVKPDEERRVGAATQTKASLTQGEEDRPAPPRTAPRSFIQSPLFTSWNSVTNISTAHRSYLSGLMRPDLPPRFPQLPASEAEDSKQQSSITEESNCEATRHSPIYPTWLLKPNNIETKGFGPAQALKDSYLAHITAWILRGALQEVTAVNKLPDDSSSNAVEASTHSSQQPLPPAAGESSDAGQPIVHVVLVVCGLGHCEYGFGAPERVVQLLSQQDAPSSHSLIPMTYIIASKPLDSGIWLGYEHPLQSVTSEQATTDDGAVTQAHPVTEEPQTVEPKEVTRDAVKQWLSGPWDRKMADAVLLYNWIDDQPAEEANTNADEDQLTSDQPKQDP